MNDLDKIILGITLVFTLIFATIGVCNIFIDNNKDEYE